MAKGQQRSNREKKKPKAAKAAVAAAQTSQMKGSLSPLNLPKKKG